MHEIVGSRTGLNRRREVAQEAEILAPALNTKSKAILLKAYGDKPSSSKNSTTMLVMPRAFVRTGTRKSSKWMP